MDSITTEYANAVASGNTQYASYLAQIMHGIGMDPQAAASVGMQPSAAQAPATNWLGNAMDWIDKFDPTSPQNGGGGIGGIVSQAGGAVVKAIPGGSAVTKGLAFISDVPRVATTVIGALLIAAGIFALAGGSHRQIIQLVKPSP